MSILKPNNRNKTAPKAMNKLLEPTEAMIDAGRNAALLREDDELHNLHDKAKYVYNAMITKSEAISKLLAAVEVLKFYADEKNYLTIHAENPAPHVVMDDGHRAREAIKALEE